MGETEFRMAPAGVTDVDVAVAVLSQPERRRYERAPDTSRMTFLAGRVLLRTLVSELTGLNPADVPLAATCPDCERPHGCPTLDGIPLGVSLAHTDGLVVAAAAWNRPVGIDVERDRPGAESAIGSLTGYAALEHWVRVEAVLKADGRGLRVDPRDVVMEECHVPVQPPGAVIATVTDRPARYLVSRPPIAPGYLAAAAVGI